MLEAGALSLHGHLLDALDRLLDGEHGTGSVTTGTGSSLDTAVGSSTGVVSQCGVQLDGQLVVGRVDHDLPLEEACHGRRDLERLVQRHLDLDRQLASQHGWVVHGLALVVHLVRRHAADGDVGVLVRGHLARPEADVGHSVHRADAERLHLLVLAHGKALHLNLLAEVDMSAEGRQVLPAEDDGHALQLRLGALHDVAVEELLALLLGNLVDLELGEDELLLDILSLVLVLLGLARGRPRVALELEL